MIDSNLLSRMEKQSTSSVISTVVAYLIDICEYTALAIRSHMKCVFGYNNLVWEGEFDHILFKILAASPLKNIIATLSNYLDKRDYGETAQILLLFYKFEIPSQNLEESEDFLDIPSQNLEESEDFFDGYTSEPSQNLEESEDFFYGSPSEHSDCSIHDDNPDICQRIRKDSDSTLSLDEILAQQCPQSITDEPGTDTTTNDLSQDMFASDLH